MIRAGLVFFLIWISFLATAQEIISGQVVDLLSGEGIASAEVHFKDSDSAIYTNSLGEFRISHGNDTVTVGEINIRGNLLSWNITTSGTISIYNMSGQLIRNFTINVGTGEETLRLLNGIYVLKANMASGQSYQTKFVYNADQYVTRVIAVALTKSTARLSSMDTLVIQKNGYYTQEYPVNQSYAVYDMMQTSYPAGTDFLRKLIRPESFNLMAGPPLNPVFSEIRSVKILYSIKDDDVYYINSEKYFIHYEFARDVLGYNKGHAMFNQEQYTNNPDRKYILATLNLFVSSGIYTLDFFSGDQLSCRQIEEVYNKVVQTTYVGNNLRFYANNLKWDECNSIPSITSNELFSGQNYQPLNPEEAYGYLKKFTLDELKTEYAGRHDIVVLNGIPNDISVVAGIITTEFQTPLSHINVLSHNRGAPNMALRDGWTNPLLGSLTNQLVYLKVTLDTFILREATLDEATQFWNGKEPSKITKLSCDTITQGLINLENSGIQSVRTIGGKAANFAELMNVGVTPYGSISLPEGAFAIPFYYYWQHMRTHSLDKLMREMLSESRFHTDFQYRKSQLIRLQDSIKSCPLDPDLLALVIAKINQTGGFTNIRFRSSTNSEDVKGFNGAGLYDSYTGIPGDPDKTIEKAIKKVWASLWNLQAFEEREYFKIDHQTVAMAVLVHRSFPDEAANGVVITTNLYNIYNPGFTINVQAGEISITNPEGGYIPDQIIRYTFEDVIEYINHSNAPGMEGKTVLSNAEIEELTAWCQAINDHYCRLYSECQPLDIEFKVDIVNGRRKLYIKQARIY
ncbi:MAG TPA: PEP/pyruvate-binding domain-containing protein [Bacteroidales bacterium]|nr:PEP/pyruvate-binding domain-containing protein [Bacteroidales bacterium]